jgi:hypothetical protein
MSAAGEHAGDGFAQTGLIDLALGAGTPAELAPLRAAVASDPFVALEFAETRNLIEEFRELRVMPSADFAHSLESVVLRAQRWQALRRAPAPLGKRLLPYLAAAAMLLASLLLLDPLRLGPVQGSREPELPQWTSATRIALTSPSAPVRLRRPEALATIHAAAERLGGGAQLPTAVQQYLNLSQSDRLAVWLQATTAAESLRERFEARSSMELRRKLLQRRNAAAMDDRIQTLAHNLAADLRAPEELPLPAVAMGVRALVAAGNAEAIPEELWSGANRLADLLPSCRGGELANVLLALAECAAATGRNAPWIQEHGERLLQEILECDGEVWVARLPAWLTGRMSTSQCADAGRFLAIAPAYGLDVETCILVRLLLAAHLQHRRAVQAETPELLAALLYGFGDVMLKADVHEIEVRLAAWRWSSLEPQFTTLQHLYWSLVPTSSGYAHFRREAERTEALPEPEAVLDRAAFCLALAAGYAGGAVRATVRPGY